MDDRYVAKRVIYLLGMSAATILFTTAAAFIRGQYLDEWIVLVIINLVFLALWFFLLEHCRMKRSIAGNRETSYQRIFAGYLASLGVTAVCLVLPEFSRPVMLSAILMLGVGNIELSLCSGLFFCSLLGFLCGGTIQEFSMYILLVLIGAVAADAAENSKKQFWYEWFAGMAGMLLPVLFYYLTYREISARIMVSAVADGVVVFLFLHLCYRKLADARNAEVDEVMVDITDESYPLARELANFSKADYRHARRVMLVAARCAAVVGADEHVCSAAGMYYRIGVLEGVPLAKNGVKMAQKACFPEKVIRIIGEYNGEEALPSTIESAIVHMVDGLLKKLEVLDEDTVGSNWNQDMVIYQTLNEYSAAGLYDRSGLSMNMFLKIREYLVNEEALLV